MRVLRTSRKLTGAAPRREKGEGFFSRKLTVGLPEALQLENPAHIFRSPKAAYELINKDIRSNFVKSH